MGDQIKVRDYQPADRTAVIALLESLQRAEIRIFDRMRAADAFGAAYLDHIGAECAAYDGRLLIAERMDRILGCATILNAVAAEEVDEQPYVYALLGDLVVAEDSRGRGIGRALIAAAEMAARAAGRRWMRVSVLAGNGPARGLYGDAGFSDHLITLEKTL